MDWAHRDSARARMLVLMLMLMLMLVKRILRKYSYPPDLQDTAVQTVLQQAESLSSELDGFIAENQLDSTFPAALFPESDCQKHKWPADPESHPAGFE